MNDLKGKNIIVTGASGGIGNSIIKKFELFESFENILSKKKKQMKMQSIKRCATPLRSKCIPDDAEISHQRSVYAKTD